MKSRSRGFLTALTALAVFLGLAVTPSAAHAAPAAHAADAAHAAHAAGAGKGSWGRGWKWGWGGGGGWGRLSTEETVAAMQPGWNLGNTFDATGDDETSWGNPRVTREQLSAIRDQGFRSIRIPVTWGQHLGPAPSYTIDPEYLERVEEVVDWALDEGFYVMINLHHDSWQWVKDLPVQHDAVLERYSATWTQIADTFRYASHRLLFESINEPSFEGSSGDAQNAELMHELNTTFHTIVRESGGRNDTRLLVLPTLHTSPEQARLDELTATFTELDDPRLVATVHYYGFWPFSVNVAGYTTFDATTQQDLTDTFDRVHDTFTAEGIPVIVGEYGLLGFDRSTSTIQQGEKLKFFEYLGNYARQRQLTTMLWDNGQHFNRTELEWNDPELYQQIASSWTVHSGTASTDQIFVREGEAPSDATVTLNLNDPALALTSVSHGSEELVQGEDYTVGGDQLTIRAHVLAELTEEAEYGTNAVLTVNFSQGVPWDLHVITYDTPVLEDATGTTDSLAIPTAFRGDQLATMEAVYADGSFAGPHNWTSYKEFGAAFSPDYDAGEITLPPAFFNEVDDNSTVTLTFHFWSGAELTYTLERAGTAVTGTVG